MLCRVAAAAVVLPLMGSFAIAQQRLPQNVADEQRLSPEERAMESLREQLRATEPEWSVLQPRIQRIIDLKQGLMSVQGSALANASGRRFRGGGAQAGPAAAAYRQSLEDIGRMLNYTPDSAAAIRRSIDAARQARAEAEQEIANAEQELLELLTAAQEAILVQFGVLD
jgi:hypothetical protein